jgi:hypothetical protein
MIYDGTTPLDDAIAFDLKLCGVKSMRTLKALKFEAIHALQLDIKQNQRISETSDKLKIYQWLKENKVVVNLPTSETNKRHKTKLQTISQSNLEPPAPIPEADLLVNDLPTVEPAPTGLNLIHNATANNDAVLSDKFISVHYRHADNSRHTVQLEQFYIDALKAIGIDDVSKFVAENAGVTTVTKNVKRAIVNVLVNCATGGKK